MSSMITPLCGNRAASQHVRVTIHGLFNDDLNMIQAKQTGRPSSRTFATQADNSASAAGSAAKLQKEVMLMP